MLDKFMQRFGSKPEETTATSDTISKSEREIDTPINTRFKKVEFGGLNFNVVKDRSIIDELSERELAAMFADWRATVEDSKLAHVLKYNPLEMYANCTEDTKEILTFGLGKIKSLTCEVEEHHTETVNNQFINNEADSNIHVAIKRNIAMHDDITRVVVYVGDKPVMSCAVQDCEGPVLTEVEHMVPGEWFNTFSNFVIQEAPVIKGQFERQLVIAKSKAIVSHYKNAVQHIPVGTYVVGTTKFAIPELPDGTLDEQAEVAENAMQSWRKVMLESPFVKSSAIETLAFFAQTKLTDFVKKEFQALNIRSLKGVVFGHSKPEDYILENPDATSGVEIELDVHQYGASDEYDIVIKSNEQNVYEARLEGGRNIVHTVIPGGWLHAVDKNFIDKLNQGVHHIHTFEEYGYVVDRRQLANEMFDF